MFIDSLEHLRRERITEIFKQNPSAFSSAEDIIEAMTDLDLDEREILNLEGSAR